MVADLIPASSPGLSATHSTLCPCFSAPARVHAQQHLGPVLTLGSARAGVHLEIGVVGVGLAGKQALSLLGLEPAADLGEHLLGLGRQRLVALGLGQRNQLDGVLELARDGATACDRFPQARALSHQRLRRPRVVPEGRILDQRIEFREPG